MINVTIFNEFIHEKEMENVKAIYPNGIHEYLKSFLQSDEINVTTVTLDDPDCGITDELLSKTDVMLWWAHCRHEAVADEIARKVSDNVLKGMGLIVLHSGHKSKPFMNLMGTTCSLRWRDDDRERIWCTSPNHPIAKGIPDHFELDVEEMYGEFFDIPTPDEVVFTGWFNGGNVFRSGCTFKRGYGKVFYFQPGHESNPTYHNPIIQQIITNAVVWAKPYKKIDNLDCIFEREPLEKI